jgi:predicted metalloenzyme YecM
MNTIEKFYKDSEKFVEVLNAFAERNEMQTLAVADHIGYKCSSKEVYEEWRAIFEMNSVYQYQSIISKRRISIIKLTTPLKTILGEIQYLELSDQKPDGSQKDGFDHVEVYPAGISYDELVHELEENGNNVQEVKKPHHSTHNISLREDFKLKIEPEALMTKIQREEMNQI